MDVLEGKQVTSCKSLLSESTTRLREQPERRRWHGYLKVARPAHEGGSTDKGAGVHPRAERRVLILGVQGCEQNRLLAQMAAHWESADAEAWTLSGIQHRRRLSLVGQSEESQGDQRGRIVAPCILPMWASSRGFAARMGEIGRQRQQPRGSSPPSLPGCRIEDRASGIPHRTTANDVCHHAAAEMLHQRSEFDEVSSSWTCRGPEGARGDLQDPSTAKRSIECEEFKLPACEGHARLQRRGQATRSWSAGWRSTRTGTTNSREDRPRRRG